MSSALSRIFGQKVPDEKLHDYDSDSDGDISKTKVKTRSNSPPISIHR
jgi:hypothetical protein